MSRRKLQPYPGLRAFERAESRIFFGRQQQIDELLIRLKKHQFLAVLGASGSGKSSLVKAGLLSGLEKGYMGEVGSCWSIAEMRPGDQPFMRLAEALLTDKTFATAWNKDTKSIPTLTAELRRGSRSLHEILTLSLLPQGTRLLLLVDQFEEIFRFREQQQNQAVAFVALLLEATQHPDIYVVITMRSDFLGDAAEFHQLPEAINDGLYLIPRLTREQLQQAIALPVQLFGGKIDAELTNHLLNEAGDDSYEVGSNFDRMRKVSDQLPLLQHAMMCLWDEDRDKTLTLTEYKALNGLRGALNDHVEQAWDELAKLEGFKGKQAQNIAELMFRALTEYNRDGQAIRRPLKVQTLLEMADTDLVTLTKIINLFRQSGCNFLMPPPAMELSAATTLDISHESLIRQWQRLQQWVVAEDKKATLYRRLQEAAQLRSDNKGGELWHGTDLALAKDWKTDNQPNVAWAARYDRGNNLDANAFQLSMDFLQESEAEEQHKQTEQEKQRKAEMTRIRRQFAYMFIGFIIAAALAFWGNIQKEYADTQAQKAMRVEKIAKKARSEAEMLIDRLTKNFPKKSKCSDTYKNTLIESQEYFENLEGEGETVDSLHYQATNYLNQGKCFHLEKNIDRTIHYYDKYVDILELITKNILKWIMNMIFIREKMLL